MVVNRQRRVRVALKPLEVFVERVQQTLRLAGHDLTICLVSDPAMARMNRAFRGKRGPTDVLSFPADGQLSRRRGKKAGRQERKAGSALRAQRSRNGAKRSPAASYLGDMAISPETARRNARRFKRALPAELRTLILHGILHLAGYDHETDRGEMYRLERRLRRRLGLG